MKYFDDLSDERLKGACPQCGAGINGDNTSSDHVPSRCLLRKEYPNDLPVMPTCPDCNRRFSKDEEYLSLFLQCVLVGSTDPEAHNEATVRRALQRHTKLRSLIEESKTEVAIGTETLLVWKPDDERVNRVTLKNARGHVYYEYGQPVVHKPDHVRALPLVAMTPKQRTDFENPPSILAGWPEVGSRMMTRLAEGQDLRNGWIVVQDGIYRYRVDQVGGFLVQAVLHEYLATEVCWSDEG